MNPNANQAPCDEEFVELDEEECRAVVGGTRIIIRRLLGF